LFALATFSLGIPGAILAFKALDCSESRRQKYWETNYVGLPEEVTAAYDPRSDTDIFNWADYQFVELGNTTYFSGSPAPAIETSLYTISNGSMPQKVGIYRRPRWLTKISTYPPAICFVQFQQHYFVDDGEYTIHCGDQETGFRALPIKRGKSVDRLMSANGKLRCRYFVDDIDHYAVMSVNITRMVATLHSEEHSLTTEAKETPNSTNHCGAALWVVTGLFLVSLPISLASLYTWIKWSVPSSSVTLYIGLGMLFSFLFGLLDPSYPEESVVPGLFLWSTVGAFLWVIAASFQIALDTRAAIAPLKWSILYMLSQISIISCLGCFFLG
jgi:hypothetical protein